MTTGKTVAVFQFHSGVSEIFAIDMITGISNPLIAGASVDQQDREVWIVPGERSPRPMVGSRMSLFGNQSSNHCRTVVPTVFSAKGLNHDRDGRATISDAAMLVELGNRKQDQNDQPSALLCYQRAL